MVSSREEPVEGQALKEPVVVLADHLPGLGREGGVGWDFGIWGLGPEGVGG